ncbi:hypothetical protein LCGC14_2532350 [marine sediment metagenome]|uniref:Uncharacterized protein n=1 Tax=marine sediment metagenome TaxID=412755 RepID=A0A0F9AT67_9ZZZZ
MKLPFWLDPKAEIAIIEASEEAAKQYGHRFSSDFITLTEEHMAALRAGKMLAWSDSEYSTFVVLEAAL